MASDDDSDVTVVVVVFCGICWVSACSSAGAVVDFLKKLETSCGLVVCFVLESSEDTVSKVVHAVPPDDTDLDSAGGRGQGGIASEFALGFFTFVPKKCSIEDCLRGSGDPVLTFFCRGVGGPAPGGSGRFLLFLDDDMVSIAHLERCNPITQYFACKCRQYKYYVYNSQLWRKK